MGSILSLLLMAQPVVVEANDYLYVYGATNDSYQCAFTRVYLETDDGSSLIAVGCSLTGSDTATWPLFPPMPINLLVDGVALPDTCQFVAYANSITGSTSTVIDCRNPQKE